jgi:hypothetical protein
MWLATSVERLLYEVDQQFEHVAPFCSRKCREVPVIQDQQPLMGQFSVSGSMHAWPAERGGSVNFERDAIVARLRQVIELFGESPFTQ